MLRTAKQRLPKGENQLRINEDMTKYDYMRRKKALPHMHKFYEEGEKVAFRNGKLIVDGRDTPFDW